MYIYVIEMHDQRFHMAFIFPIFFVPFLHPRDLFLRPSITANY
jgi:hypothetical protein